MKIKRKLQVISILPVLLVVIIGLLLYFSHNRLSLMLSKDKKAEEIGTQVFELNILTNEYMRHLSNRPKEQWVRKYSMILDLLEEVKVAGDEEIRTLDVLMHNHIQVGVLFDEFAKRYENHEKGDGIFERSAYKEILAGQLMIRLQAMVASTTKLNDLNHENLEKFYLNSALLIIVFMVIMVSITYLVLSAVGRSIYDPLLKLKQAIEVISGGNLNYKTEINSQDEIGELSRSFDEMTTHLRDSRSLLEESEKRLKLALMSADQGLYDLNVQTGEAIVNDQYALMLGYEPSEFTETNQRWLERLHPEDSERVASYYQAYMRGETDIYRVELRQRTKTGEWKWILSVGKVVEWDTGGNPVRMLGTHTDISEHKNMETQIRAQLAEKEVLLREVHHRVKNNFQVISSLLSLQSRYIADESLREVFREGETRIKSMSLVHEMLYRSNDLSMIDLGTYLQELVKSLKRTYKLSGQRAKIIIDVENIVLGIENVITLGLIINELLSNAMKHAFAGDRMGEIILSMHRTKMSYEYELVVSDNGIGLPEDMDIRETQSLGLRLIVNLTEVQLGGTFELDRENGTEFRIRFRAVPGENESVEQSVLT